jgi:hypothetical protein
VSLHFINGEDKVNLSKMVEKLDDDKILEIIKQMLLDLTEVHTPAGQKFVDKRKEFAHSDELDIFQAPEVMNQSKVNKILNKFVSLPLVKLRSQ